MEIFMKKAAIFYSIFFVVWFAICSIALNAFGEETSVLQKKVQKSPVVAVEAGPATVVVQPRPVVVQPRPIVVQPRPIVVRPQPVVVQPRPVVVVPRYVVAPPPFVAPPKPNFPTPIRDSIWGKKVKKQERQWYKYWNSTPIIVLVRPQPQPEPTPAQ
jgi:hypothetical protein